jgi:predicted transcriptional regulator
MKSLFKPANIGPLEQKILSVVWKNTAQACTVSNVLEILSKEGETLAYTTVMTILNRLVEKNYLVRKKEGRSFCYHPVEQQKSFLQKLIRSTIHNFANTFGEEAISAFAKEASALSSQHKTNLQQKIKQEQ